jgi:hypothetical protein
MLDFNASMISFQEQGRLRSPAREWAARIGLMFASLLFAVLLAEGLSRIFAPISDLRENIALDGTRIRDFLTPGSVYRQVSNEYDALTTITEKGHRVPVVEGNPDIVFIGDSFTFGYGLSDEQTFVSLYCRRQRLTCANLGQPGSGTLRQVERLEQFLKDWSWQPREVRLFVFAMSGSFSAGNDFVDNYDRERRMQVAAASGGAPTELPQAEAAGVAERIIGMQSFLLRHSNLMRLLKFYAGPLVKSLIVAEPGEQRMAIALDATRNALARLDALSRERGFEYSIYLIVPVNDILRGTQDQTFAMLNGVSPKPAIATAQLYVESPAQYYYAFDGHLNPEGNRLMADFLVSRDPAEGH